MDDAYFEDPEQAVEDRSLSSDELDDLLVSENQPPEVTYSTQDFPVDALVKRMQRGSMRIPQFGGSDKKLVIDGFQRGFVWSKAQMDRFIESLLLGYPVPGIFLVKQADNVMLILDGQQRMETLRRFYDGVHGERKFRLENVGEDFRGLTYETLGESLQLKLDDSFLHATIVSTDGSKVVNDAIYGIFERLNSGGTQLTPHEIRVALYAGPLMVTVEKLNNDADWRELYGAKNKRIRDHELVMRIIALFIGADSYSRPLKRFLNNFCNEHREDNALPKETENLFRSAATALLEAGGRETFRRVGSSQINTAQAEAMMVGTMRNIAARTLSGNLKDDLESLRDNDVFARAVTRSTADNEAVRDRLRLATETLSQS